MNWRPWISASPDAPLPQSSEWIEIARAPNMVTSREFVPMDRVRPGDLPPWLNAVGLYWRPAKPVDTGTETGQGI